MELIILKGLLIGFISSVSFGPIALIIIQKTENNHHQRGLMAGFGASTAETIFAIVAGSGVGLAYNFIEQYQLPIRLIGSLIILAVGLKIVLTKKPSGKPDKTKRVIGQHISDFSSTFWLEIFNPLTLFMFIFLFSTFNVIPKGISNLELFKLYYSVFIGTNIWWTLVVILANILRKKIKLQHTHWLNKITGSIIMIIGLGLIISLLADYTGLIHP